jgi:hypothetical protein
LSFIQTIPLLSGPSSWIIVGGLVVILPVGGLDSGQ